MTPTQELNHLRVRVREMEEELREWERTGIVDDMPDDLHVLSKALNLRPQAVELATILCSMPGRFRTTGYLHERIARSEDASGNLVSVAVSHLRTALKAKGIRDVLISAYGHGYMITPEGARQVRALVEG